MTNIIDNTYFRGALLIANAVSAPNVAQYITVQTTEKQEDFLIDMMGAVLYSKFEQWQAAGSAAGLWFDLMNGKTFSTTEGMPVKWVGLKNAKKVSPLANYLYYELQKDSITKTVSGGEAKPKAQNAERGSAEYKMVQAWNCMVDMLGPYVLFMDTFFTTQNPDGSPADWPKYRSYAECKDIFQKTNVFYI